MKTKYIHIGYPKNFSTSLQRDYFAKHPELYHLGIGIDSNLGYRDSLIEKTLEVYLKSCKEFKYNEVKEAIKKHFTNLFNKLDSRYKATGISAEHLSFAFTHDGLSATEKAKRLFEIFGKETKIIMVVRNQMDLLKSLYKESVRVGFAGDFETYINTLYKYQDRNFLYDFRYDLVYSLYADFFGENNIKVLFFEDYKKPGKEALNTHNTKQLFEALNTFLGLRQVDMEFKHYNIALPDNKILIKAKLNKQNPHDLSNPLTEIAEKHRIKTYLEEDLEYFETETETYADVATKRRLIDQALTSTEEQELTFKVNTAVYKKIQHFYAQGNTTLQQKTGLLLPNQYTQFPK